MKNIPQFYDWLASQKGIEKGPDARYFATVDFETKDINEADKTMVVTISTKTKDRAGDTLSPRGVVLDNYLKNPVVLWAHDYMGKPIAKALWTKIQNAKIKSKPKFAPTAEAQEIFELYKGGFLNAWSVGFIPEEYKERFKKGTEEFEGYDITKWELLEYSAVPVPANPEALTNAYHGGKIKLSPSTAKMLGLEEACKAGDKEACDEIEAPDEGKTIPDDLDDIIKQKTATFKYCVCECGYYEDKVAGEPCQDIECPECGESLKGSNEKPKAKEVEEPKEVDEDKLEAAEHKARILEIANNAIVEELASLKEGRVISTKNLKTLKDARDALNAVIAMAEKEEDKEEDKEDKKVPQMQIDVDDLAGKIKQGVGEMVKAETARYIRKLRGKID